MPYSPDIREPILEKENWQFYPKAGSVRIISICDDSKGNLYLGTHYSGVLFFDGVSFTSIGLKGEPIHSLTALDNDTIIAATDGNIYSLKNGNWTSILPVNKHFLWLASSLFKKSDEVWASSQWGLFKLNSKSGAVEVFYTSLNVRESFRKIFPTLPSRNISDSIVPSAVPDNNFGFHIITSLSLRNMSFVASVSPGSPAEKVGLQPGDYIVKVDGKSNINVNHYLKQQLEIDLTIMRNNTKSKFHLSAAEECSPAKVFTPTAIYIDTMNRFWLNLFRQGIALFQTPDPSRNGMVWTEENFPDISSFVGYSTFCFEYPLGTVRLKKNPTISYQDSSWNIGTYENVVILSNLFKGANDQLSLAWGNKIAGIEDKQVIIQSDEEIPFELSVIYSDRFGRSWSVGRKFARLYSKGDKILRFRNLSYPDFLTFCLKIWNPCSNFHLP